MKAVDCRQETWQSVQKRLEGDRLKVYQLLLRLGPCTTRQMALESAALSILTIRPRMTELVSLGLARCVGRKTEGVSEGIYQAISLEEAKRNFEKPAPCAAATQQVLF
jgi:hypothetical protein